MFQPIAVCGPGCGRKSTSSAATHGECAELPCPSASDRGDTPSQPRTRSGRVVVDAEDVERLRGRLLVALVHERPVGDARGVGEQVRRVGAVEHRPEEGPVGQRVDAPHRVAVGLRRRSPAGSRAGSASPTARPPAPSRGRPGRPGRGRGSGGARRPARRPARCGRARARPRRSRGTPRTTARSAWSRCAPGRREPRRCRRRSPAKRSAVSRTGQPPASSSSCGRSQWYIVATGRTPSSSSRSTSRE